MHSKVRRADQEVAAWQNSSGLLEVPNWPPKATWRACLHAKKAVLDRAWVYPTNLPVSPLSVLWASDRRALDHAMILLRLPQAAAGIGYAGSCRPLHQAMALPRSRADPKRLKKRREEWTRLVCEGLTALRAQGHQPDPFQALMQE